MPVPGPKQVLSNKTADPQAGQLIPPDGLELRENHTFDRLQWFKGLNRQLKVC